MQISTLCDGGYRVGTQSSDKRADPHKGKVLYDEAGYVYISDMETRIAVVHRNERAPLLVPFVAVFWPDAGDGEGVGTVMAAAGGHCEMEERNCTAMIALGSLS